jgi:hypothetical protein
MTVIKSRNLGWFSCRRWIGWLLRGCAAERCDRRFGWTTHARRQVGHPLLGFSAGEVVHASEQNERVNHGSGRAC